MTWRDWRELRNLCAMAQHELRNNGQDRSLFYGVLDTVREYSIRRMRLEYVDRSHDLSHDLSPGS